MKERKNQFVTPELAAEGVGAGAVTSTSPQSSGQTSKGTKFQILPDKEK